MITIFNRKELVTTFSCKRQIDVRALLEQHHINYTYKIINRNSTSPFGDTRSRTGTFGQNLESTYQFIFYVHKADYEKAKFVIKL